MKIECPLSAAARRNPEGPALWLNAETLSLRQLDAEVAQVAAHLELRGCSPGTYVALLLPNGRHMVVCLLALMRLGAIACPLNTRNPPQMLREQLRLLNIRWLIAKCDVTETLKDSKVVIIDPEPFFGVGQSKKFDSHVRPRRSDQPAVVLFTSGSTATPKAALLTLGNLVSNAQSSNQITGLQAEDCWLLSLPLFHVGGLGIVFRCLESGAAFAIGRKDETLCEALARYPISHLSLVPTQLQRLLDERCDPEIVARLKCILLGGAPAPDALVREALRTGLPIRKTYGLTEMSSQVSTVSAEAPAEKQLTAGRVLPGCEVKVAYDGELWVRGPMRFAGYLEAGCRCCPFDNEGWFATGDLGHLDGDGYLTVLGRKDNLFITGGENVQPEEIEAALCALEGVAQALVVAVDDREFGSRPVAFVRMVAGRVDDQELRGRIQAVLPHYKIPTRFFDWPDIAPGSPLKVPRTEYGRLAQALSNDNVAYRS